MNQKKIHYGYAFKIVIMIIVLALIFYVARYLLNRYNQETTLLLIY